MKKPLKEVISDGMKTHIHKDDPRRTSVDAPTRGHTPEPWRVTSPGRGCLDIMGKNGVARMHVDPAVNTKHPTADEAVMNANRIVACVNACEEINPEAVKDLLAAARLVAVSEDRPKFQNLLVDSDAVEACRAAIAKAEGK